MMWLPCPECGRLILSNVEACTGCGCPPLNKTNAAKKDGQGADRITYKGRITKNRHVQQDDEDEPASSDQPMTFLEKLECVIFIVSTLLAIAAALKAYIL